MRPITDANGSPLLDGQGHGFASIVAGQGGHCPVLCWWKLGPGRIQSAWWGEWSWGWNSGVNHQAQQFCLRSRRQDNGSGRTGAEVRFLAFLSSLKPGAHAKLGGPGMSSPQPPPFLSLLPQTISAVAPHRMLFRTEKPIPHWVLQQIPSTVGLEKALLQGLAPFVPPRRRETGRMPGPRDPS